MNAAHVAVTYAGVVLNKNEARFVLLSSKGNVEKHCPDSARRFELLRGPMLDLHLTYLSFWANALYNFLMIESFMASN